MNPSEQPDTHRPPPLPKRKSGRQIVLGLAAIIAGPWLLWAGWFFSNVNAARRIEARIQARGEPLTLADLAETYSPIPDSENAAVPLLDAWEKDQPSYWRAIRNGERPGTSPPRPVFDPNLPFLGQDARVLARGTLSASNRLAAERHLEEMKAHMDAMRSAIQRPRSRFPIKIQDGYAALLPHLEKIRTEAQNFQIEALIASEKGRTKEALGAIGNIKRLADTLSEEPVTIGQLFRLQCLNRGLDGMEHLMSRQKLTVGELHTLEELLQEMRLTNVLRRYFLAERAVSLSIFEMSSYQASQLVSARHTSADGILEQAQGTRVMGWFFKLTGVAAADRRLVLETMTRALALAEQGPPEMLAGYRSLEHELDAELKKFPPRFFSRMLLPSVDKVVNRSASYEARRRAAIVACAIERERQSRDGKLPQSFAELGPAFPASLSTDPFNGRSLAGC